MALEIFRLVGSVFVDTDKADKSLQKTDKNAAGIGSKLLGAGKAAGKFALGVAGAATAAGAALVAVAENTREYRNEQGKLQAAFETSGFAAKDATDTYQALNGVLGDSGQAVEASNHLAKLCDDAEDLATWTDICTGVYATFGDSLPIEGLTEAANETAKTGALTGGLADALNWAGVNEDAFQASLDACNTEQERQALITETLNGLYSEAADKYREVNGDVIAANEAQEKLNASMAAIGGAIEPFLTAGKELLASVLEKVTPIIQRLAEWLIPLVGAGIERAKQWIQELSLKLSESGITFQSVMDWIKNAFQNVMNVLKVIWDTVGKPVWDFIKQSVGLVAEYFAERMPAIKEFVRKAFSDIKNIWEQNLKPALKAIGDFINNVLAPAFKWVFEKVIAPTVDRVFGGIKDLWNKSLKPALQNILDFITNVFSGNFSGAFKSLLNSVKNIWNGLEIIIKTPVNAIIGLLNDFIRSINRLKIPDWVPGAGGKSLNLPMIPKLQDGAVLERGQVGLLEGNGAEAVVPLERNKKWISAVARDMDSAFGGGSSGQVVALLQDILDALAEIAEMGVYLDRDKLVGGLGKAMDRELGRIQAQKARA